MPVVRTDPEAKAKRIRARVPVECPVCEKVVNRKADLTRHMQTHNKGAGRYTCPHDDCTYATLQKSNLTTHVRTHTGEKRFECQDDPGLCDFRTSDPAAFTRHRKKKHGYVPQARSRKGSIATDQLNQLSTPSTATTSGTPVPQGALEIIINNVPAVPEVDEREDDWHPSPATTDDEHESDDESDSSDSSSSVSPRSLRAYSRESSVESEVDEFITKTIDSLKHVVGRRQRGSSGSLPPLPLPHPAVPPASHHHSHSHLQYQHPHHRPHPASAFDRQPGFEDHHRYERPPV